MALGGEPAPPSFISNELLEAAFRCGDSDVVTYKSVSPATRSGVNFLSRMLRVRATVSREGRSEEKSVIVKTMPRGELMVKLALGGQVFLKETAMFRDVLPAMYELLQEASPGKYQRFAAQHIYSIPDSQKPLLALEDLKPQGFRMAEGLHGVDMDHCLFVLRNLARFHAASLALRQKQPEMFQPFSSTIFREELKSALEGFFPVYIKKLAKEVEKWPEYERFAAKLHQLSHNAMDIFINAVERKEGEFTVLAHGDLWLNNVMFNYSKNSGEVEDVRFVDFQLSYWTSPSIDLLYFLNSSAAMDICDRYDVFIGEYHKALGETLASLGLEGLQPSLEQLNDELHRRGKFGAVAGTAVRIVVQTDRSSEKTQEDSNGGGSPQFNEVYKDAIKKLLLFYEKKGWLG